MLFRRKRGPKLTAYVPNAYPWEQGAGLVQSEPVPRANREWQGNMPRVWPAIYGVRLMGMGTMPTFVLGPTDPVFNNQIAGGAPGFNIMMPGLSKLPFGD